MSGMQPRKRPEGQGRIPAPRKHRSGGSCAECKRLKIKCAKGPHDAFPCESCVRRGCQSICPSGCLTAGRAGNRFVLANTEQLHDKILELSNRVRELEDALQELQATSSTETHPLLRKELLLVKAPLESETVLADGDAPAGRESLDAFGSLSITGPGRSNFHGQGAGAWFFLQNEDPDPDDDEAGDGGEFQLPSEILYASDTFPLGTLTETKRDLRFRIQSFIPPRDVAHRLVENYFNGMGWWYDPIPRPQFTSTVFEAVYTAQFPHICTCDMHALALLFLILAIGTSLDLDMPNYSPQATRYYQLGRASLALDLSLDEPCLAAVQALHLMCFFLHMSDMKGGFGMSWALMGLNAKLAVGIGLHRDSAKWNLGGEDRIRQQVFWELYTYDTWQALPCGRPPSFHRLSVDCKMPYTHLLSPDVTTDNPGDVFKAWKHRFCYDRLSPMMEQSFGPRTPSYATILLLDRKIREDPVPPILQLNSADGLNNICTLTMQRYAVLCVREISLLLMHRPFFAQAAAEKAPLEAKFAPSVLAVYRSSCSIIVGVRALYDQQPRLAPRAWFFWAHIFSATICLGGLVVRCPSLGLASSALAQVESACELFGKVKDSNRVSKSLPSMLKLREKARHALTQYRAGQDSLSPNEREQDSELSALVGETRLVSHRNVAQQLPSPARSTDVHAPSQTMSYNYEISPQQPVAVQGYSVAESQQQANNPAGYTGPTYAAIEPDISVHQMQYAPQVYADYPSQLEQIPPSSLHYAWYPEEYCVFPSGQCATAQRESTEQQQVFVQHGAWHNFVSQLGMDPSS